MNRPSPATDGVLVTLLHDHPVGQGVLRGDENKDSPGDTLWCLAGKFERMAPSVISQASGLAAQAGQGAAGVGPHGGAGPLSEPTSIPRIVHDGWWTWVGRWRRHGCSGSQASSSSPTSAKAKLGGAPEQPHVEPGILDHTPCRHVHPPRREWKSSEQPLPTRLAGPWRVRCSPPSRRPARAGPAGSRASRSDGEPQLEQRRLTIVVQDQVEAGDGVADCPADGLVDLVELHQEALPL